MQSTEAHQAINKCSRHVWVKSQIFTTGVSKTRDREYSLFDPRNFSTSIKTQRVDTNTGTLIPLVDRSRNIVYLAGRGDMTLRWVEIGGTSTFVEGNAPIPVTTLGAALAPPSILNLMKAEINRVIILSKDDMVVPVAMEIPRRQYIDFHAELYPSVADIGAFSNTRHNPSF